MRRLFIGLALTLLLATPAAEARRRSVRVTPPRPAPATPAEWLLANAYRLHSVDLANDSSDLAPLHTLAAGASIIGLGDGSHGTREFYTVKLRLIDALVRELGFDVISLEAPYPLFRKLNAWVQGGEGDPKALLQEAGRLGYFFWDCEEILAVLEWMRAYNAHRGERAPVTIAGADIFEPRGAAENVLQFLRGADPSVVGSFESDYTCVLNQNGLVAGGCPKPPTESALSRLEARRNDLGGGSRAAAFEEAVHNARVVVQSFSFGLRDANMAANVLWMRDHLSPSGRIAYWAHSEHVGVTLTSAGKAIRDSVGAQYFVIGTLPGSGAYLTWINTVPTTLEVPVPAAGSYESYFQLSQPPATLIPLRGEVPEWLRGPASHFFAGTAPSETSVIAKLPEKLDAVIYIHATSPIRVLQH